MAKKGGGRRARFSEMPLAKGWSYRRISVTIAKNGDTRCNLTIEHECINREYTRMDANKNFLGYA